MFTAFDIILVATALLIMAVGFARRRAVWMSGQTQTLSGSLRRVLFYLATHREILKRRTAGMAHVVLVWGVAVFMVVTIAAQFDFKLPFLFSRIISLILDLLGLFLLMGVSFFIMHRGRARQGSLDGIVPRRTLLPALLMLGIILTGFLSEGLRLSILPQGVMWHTPVGYIAAQVMPASPLIMQLMIRTHFLLVLIFMALMPYTFMRHIVASALNVYYSAPGAKRRGNAGTAERPRPFVETVNDFSWKQLLESEACVSCGRCQTHCPATLSQKALSPRKVVQQLLAAAEYSLDGKPLPVLEIATDEELWSCTTCMACVEACPVFVEPVDRIIELRRHRVMGMGALPVEARPMLRDLQLFGDTYGKGAAFRADWAFNSHVRVLGRDVQTTDYLLWVGCAGAYHPRYREVVRALVDVLICAGVDFAILGTDEQCCGDPARQMGDETLFKQLVQHNMEQLNSHSFAKIITLCPHCLHTLKHEYPPLGKAVAVQHASQLVAELIGRGSIRIKYPMADSLSIHDPCYLGRVNQVFEPLRDIGRAVPGLMIRELERNRANGFCCGGGGGRMWLHESEGKRINHMRAQEVCAAETEVVATACPYCLTMLEDGIGAMDTDVRPKVHDIIEIVAASMERKTISGS